MVEHQSDRMIQTQDTYPRFKFCIYEGSLEKLSYLSYFWGLSGNKVKNARLILVFCGIEHLNKSVKF